MSTWSKVSARAGRNDLPAILVRNFWDLSPSDQATGVERTWVMAEWPEQAIEADGWVMLFGHVLGDEHVMVDGEVVHRLECGDLDALTDEQGCVTLYRGAIEERKAGMSWTPDPAVATWFARRFDGMSETDAKVWVVTVPTDLVLAIFTGRSENEVVLDSSQLLDDDVQPVTFVTSGSDVWKHSAVALGLAEVDQ